MSTTVNCRDICIKDQIEYRCLKNGAYIVEMADFGPYKIFEADVYYCPVCMDIIVPKYAFAKAGFEHYEEGFEERYNFILKSDEPVIYVYPNVLIRDKHNLKNLRIEEMLAILDDYKYSNINKIGR